MNNRIVALIDMDCFYCQVEARLNPTLQGKPVAVVQYNKWKGGGIIAVSYEARDRGVTRHMRGKEAKNHCPEIELVHVPSVRGKADLTKYREAGREVADVLCEFSKCVERASVDEAYLDLTEEVTERLTKDERVLPVQLENSFIVGYSSQGNNDEGERAEGVARWLSEVFDGELYDMNVKKLAVGALIIEEIRAAVFKKTGFRCSAGIAHNKIMAKLVCGLHKPNRQTVLPESGLAELFNSLPVQKVRNLGGKFGTAVIETLGCKVVADLAKYSERDLQTHFEEKTGTWLFNIARGIDLDPVTPRLMSKSIGCCKKFPGRTSLHTKRDVLHWLNELATEISERLDEDYHMYKRRPQLLTASVQQTIEKKKVAMSRSNPLTGYDTDTIVNVALSAINKTNNAYSSADEWSPPLLFLGISVGKFVEESSTTSKTINQFFRSVSITPSTSKTCDEQSFSNTASTSKEIVNNSKQQHSNSDNLLKPVNALDINLKRGSFFERYFKNKKPNLGADVVVQLEDETIENEKHLLNDESNESKKSTSGNVSISRNNESMINSITKHEPVMLLKDQYKTNVSENSLVIGKEETTVSSDEINVGKEDSWISPSEIFPDINDIDEDVVSLLPSPLQRKVFAQTNEIKKQNKINHNFENDLTNVITDSDSDNKSVAFIASNSSSRLYESPTEITTLAQVYSVIESNNNRENSSEYGILEGIEKCLSQNSKDSNRKSSQDIFGETISQEFTNINLHLENLDNVVRTSPDICSGNLMENGDVDGNCTRSSEMENCNKTEISEICPHCRESIRLSEFPEHLDHHIALQLHQSLNSNESVPPPAPPRTNLPSNISLKRKRGRSTKKTPITEQSKKSKSILSFFTRK